MCNDAKNEFVSNNITYNKHNPKKFWDNLLKLWGKSKSRGQKNLYLTDPSTGQNADDEDVPILFNKFFCSIALEIQSNIPHLTPNEKHKLHNATNDTSPTKSCNNQSNEFSFRDLTNNEVIKRIENHKSSGVPEITSKMFKITAKILVPQFRFLFNLCLRTSTFPTKWKNSVVTPLFKAGNSLSAGNYRPIACIPLPGKLLEKCIHIQLYDYLESHHLLCNNQYGFRSNRNTQQAIFMYLDNIYRNLNLNIDTIAVYVDFRKAFDTVDHPTLLNKLRDFNLSPKSIELFNNYLSNRTQQVYTNKTMSPPLPIKTGVPQGSTLGPLLLVMYINSLPAIAKNSSTILFADDTVIFHPLVNQTANFDLIQKDLDLLHLWCRYNRLEINTSKTKAMYFSSKHLNSTSKPYKKLRLGKTDIDFINDYKYLGVTIDTDLTFKTHITNLINTISFKVSQLRRIRKSLSNKIALQMYKTMILPVMDYGDLFYHNKNNKLLNKLRTIQNRSIRIISQLPRLTNTDSE